MKHIIKKLIFPFLVFSMTNTAYCAEQGYLTIENATYYAEIFDRYITNMGEYTQHSGKGIAYANLIDTNNDGSTDLIFKYKNNKNDDWNYIVYDGNSCIYDKNIPYEDFFASNDISTVKWCVKRVNDRAFSSVTVQMENKFIPLTEKPIIENERILICGDDLKEYLDITLSGSNIEIRNEEGMISCSLGSKTAYIDNNEWKMEISPEMKNGRLMIPLRFAMERLGYSVDWNKSTKNIKTEKKPKAKEAFNSQNYTITESRAIEPVVISRTGNEINSILGEFQSDCDGLYRFYDIDEDKEQDLFIYPDDKGERRLHIYKYNFNKSITYGYVTEYDGDIYTYPKKGGLLFVTAKGGEEIISHMYFRDNKLYIDKIYENRGLENYIDPSAVFEGAEKLEFEVNHKKH